MLATGPATSPTRRMDPDPVTPVAPIPVPRRRPPTPAPQPVAAAPAKRSAGSRFARALGILLLIAILAGLIAGAVLLLTDAGQSTELGETIKDNVNDQIQAIEDFINENTQ